MANEKNVLGTAESTEVFNDYESRQKEKYVEISDFCMAGSWLLPDSIHTGRTDCIGVRLLAYSSSRIYWWYYSDTCRNTLWCHRCKEWSFFHSIVPIHIRKIWCNGVRNYCCTV